MRFPLFFGVSDRPSSAVPPSGAEQGVADADPPPRQPDGANLSGMSLVAGLPLAVPSPGQAFWLALFLLAVAAYWYLSRRAHALGESADPWADPTAVENTLILAADQHAPMTIMAVAPPLSPVSPNAAPERAPLGGSCALLDETRLFFQAGGPLPEGALADWAGKNARVHMRVAVGDAARLLRFDTVILRGRNDARRPLLELARPERLERFERRAFPRVAPGPDDVAALGLWAWDAALPAQPPSQPAESGELLFARHPAGNARVPSLRLADLSARGLGLCVPKRLLASVPETCIVLICPGAAARGPGLLWLACRRRHATERSGGQGVAGLLVLHWGRTSRADEPVVWQDAAESPVPPLLRWVLKRRAEEAHL